MLNPDFTTPHLTTHADPILEDTLVDIETVKRMWLNEYDWSQIASYLVLADSLQDMGTSMRPVRSVALGGALNPDMHASAKTEEEAARRLNTNYPTNHGGGGRSVETG